MDLKPVYPKPNPEARKKVLEDFYRKVRNTRWEEVDEIPRCKKGRKPKERPKAIIDMDKPRNQIFKKDKYNWL
jgi:hypothetical protein